jgi:hypothetical protein
MAFYDLLLAQFERSYEETFAKADYRKMYFVARNAEQAIGYITQYQPEELGAKWFDVPGPAKR